MVVLLVLRFVKIIYEEFKEKFVFVELWFDLKVVFYWFCLDFFFMKVFVGVCIVEIQFIWNEEYWRYVFIDFNFVDDFSRGFYIEEFNG